VRLYRLIADILLIVSAWLHVDSLRQAGCILDEVSSRGAVRRWNMVRLAIVAVLFLTAAFLIQCLREGNARPDQLEDLTVASTLFVLGLFGRVVLGLAAQAIAEARMLSVFEAASRLDPLTGIANRRHLDLILRSAVKDAHLRGAALSVLMIDVDHFKAVNDTYGHQMGDHVLRAVVATIATHLRPSDFISRFGGDEIVVVLPGARGETGREVADRVGAAVRMQSIAEAAVTVSIGIAALRPGDTAPVLLDRADEALYGAKRGGRNRACLSDDCVSDDRLGEDRPGDDRLSDGHVSTRPVGAATSRHGANVGPFGGASALQS
jgi:diguanylate cyclase (GGDEF)-like protein